MRIHSQSFVAPQEFQKAMKSKQNSPILLYCNNVRKCIIEFYASFFYIGVIPTPQQILYFVSTSNHNCFEGHSPPRWLYLILFLHQTTTIRAKLFDRLQLYLILFLHQTTTRSCSKAIVIELYLILFLHQTTT